MMFSVKKGSFEQSTMAGGKTEKKSGRKSNQAKEMSSSFCFHQDFTRKKRRYQAETTFQCL